MLFKDLYNEYCRSVYRFLLSLTGDENEAEELLQETFYRAFLNIDSFKEECSFFTWLCQIGKNAWYKECKRRKRFNPEISPDEQGAVETESVEKIVIDREQAKNVARIAKELPQPYLDVFAMRIYGEKKLSDIAEYFGKSESWARVTYFRAKSMIIEKLEEE